jgi:hypothetical protein
MAILEEYLEELNGTMIAAERKIVLLLDITSVHRTDTQFRFRYHAPLPSKYNKTNTHVHPTGTTQAA